ncbi:MAG: peptide deformylase [Chitinophagales bacterium]|nr:peptide deformylase [Chitinophagales bacterium]
MIIPIIAYGDPLLRKKAAEIDKHYTGLQPFIEDMFETMYHANGVGLAAPQVGKSIRLFIVDSIQILKRLAEQKDQSENDFKGEAGARQVFINAKTVHKDGEPWLYNEGCLSIPQIREDIERPDEITLEFFDENFVSHRQTFDGFTGRVIQHEYDHIDGILFTDHLKPLKRRLLKKKLENISRGMVDVDYKMKFPVRK